MTAQTKLIIQAARGYKAWGRLPARQFCLKRGIDLRLVRLARQLEAITRYEH